MTRDQLLQAKQLLQLSDHATLEEIKNAYRSLLKKWHPDTLGANHAEKEARTRDIITAYEHVTAYCAQYRYAFTEEEISRQLMARDWWMERFGEDPLWGNAGAAQPKRGK